VGQESRGQNHITPTSFRVVVLSNGAAIARATRADLLIQFLGPIEFRPLIVVIGFCLAPTSNEMVMVSKVGYRYMGFRAAFPTHVELELLVIRQGRELVVILLSELKASLIVLIEEIALNVDEAGGKVGGEARAELIFPVVVTKESVLVRAAGPWLQIVIQSRVLEPIRAARRGGLIEAQLCILITLTPAVADVRG